jgi:hypothetical protein
MARWYGNACAIIGGAATATVTATATEKSQNTDDAEHTESTRISKLRETR